jgi:predicted RNA methylase
MFMRQRDLLLNAKALDLACGTGCYSFALLEWGAHHVIGVDISEGMIRAARAGLETREE